MRLRRRGRRVRLGLPRLRGRKKGVVLTTEMALLILVVIVAVLIVAFGLAMHLIAQATSAKRSLVIEQAQAWVVGCSGSTETIAVSLFVQNIGSQPIAVTGAKLVLPDGGVISSTNSQTMTINPGEDQEISFYFSYNYYNYEMLSSGNSAYIYLLTSTGNQVGTAVGLEVPPGATSNGC